ncbi:uroporphyrinogen-III synthase [Psychrobacter sp. 72-O-c]|uniref:uroporphyrinogen-III synthase n=1 Tax=Psychrobacter sp. 72-O-c TaxID=2774125 RepID=UPI001918035D|nr:uroporphyrinogen-III synthase [Psychrobacter sp. 72-O-c]
MSWSSPPTYSKSNQEVDGVAMPPQVVINTRPVERAAPLTCHLQAAGFIVVDIPMLALQSRAVIEEDMRLMRQWLAGDYQTLVIVSPTAAALGLAVWQTLAHDLAHEHEIGTQYDNAAQNKQQQSDSAARLDSRIEVSNAHNHLSHIIAVGEATAAVLQSNELPVANQQVLQPAIANNEGMLVMPEIERLKAGDKVLIWRGLGGRRLLVDALQARGVHIDSIAWYERVMPTDANTHYQQWSKQFSMQKATQNLAQIQQPKPIVVISSGTAFEHWVSIVDPVQVLDSESKSDINLDLDANSNDSLPPILDTNLSNGSLLKLSDFAYVVLGERLAHMVAEQQLSYWRVEDLAPETILAAIKSSC